MGTDIGPRHQAAKPRPERVAAVTLSGCEFVVGWDGEPADYEPHHYLGGLGRQRPTAWVECVKLDGKWWNVDKVFASDFCDQLDAALLALEDFSACERATNADRSQQIAERAAVDAWRSVVPDGSNVGGGGHTAVAPRLELRG